MIDRRILTILTLGILAVSCGKSNPTAPSVTVNQAVAQPQASTGPQGQASVSDVLPASLPPSQAAQTLIVEGSNFKPGLSVVFAFTPASSANSTRMANDGPTATQTITGSAIQNVTDGSFQVTVTVPGPGTYTLRVQNPSSNPSEPVTVTAQTSDSAHPSVAGLSPRSPTQNTAVQPVYVAGNNFLSGLTVQLTAPDGSMSTVGGSSITFGSSTVFQMRVTLADTGGYSLRVVNPSGDMSDPWAFTVKPVEVPPPTPPAPPAPSTAPSIAGLSPRSPTQSTATQNVFVGGANFVSGLSVTLTPPGGGAATVGGSAIQNVTSTGFYLSTILSTVGEWHLRVTNPSGQSSDDFGFTVKSTEVPSTLAVTGLSPSSPTQSTAAQPIYVAGTGFQSGLTVALTGPNGTTSTVSGSAITFGSSTVFQMMVVLGSTGNYSLTVTNPTGPASNSWPFTVKAPEGPPPPVAPTIAGLSPRSPTQSTAAQYLFIGGANFATGLTLSLTTPGGVTTTFSGSALLSLSSTGVYISNVFGEAGVYSLKVTNPSGLASDPFSFTVKAPEPPAAPTMTGISPEQPTMGTAAQPVYVGGTGFQTGLTVTLTAPGGATSTISGSAITFGSSTIFQMMVVLPDAGGYSIVVNNPTGPSSAARTFTVKNPF